MDNNILRDLSYGVYVVSTMNGDKPTGCIANSLIQVTYDTIAVSINHDNFTNECITKCGLFGVSILGEHVDENVIPVFGFKSGREVFKFENIDSINIEGVNILTHATGYLVCKVIDKMETETHTVFLGKIIAGEKLESDKPMTYAYYHKVKKGTSPKNAPTYIEEKVSGDCWKCIICGYIYEGDLTKEPDDYICPLCKQPKSKFIKC